MVGLLQNRAKNVCCYTTRHNLKDEVIFVTARLAQSWTWIGFIHGLDWVGLDWIGLGRNFREK